MLIALINIDKSLINQIIISRRWNIRSNIQRVKQTFSSRVIESKYAKWCFKKKFLFLLKNARLSFQRTPFLSLLDGSCSSKQMKRKSLLHDQYRPLCTVTTEILARGLGDSPHKVPSNRCFSIVCLFLWDGDINPLSIPELQLILSCLEHRYFIRNWNQRRK